MWRRNVSVQLVTFDIIAGLRTCRGKNLYSNTHWHDFKTRDSYNKISESVCALYLYTAYLFCIENGIEWNSSFAQ